MQALADFARFNWERWPEQGGYLSALSMAARLQRAKSRADVHRFTGMDRELDEYPAVPYYSFDRRIFYYDSSSLAFHIDSLENSRCERLIPADRELAFLCHLIDEAFDEFGLYMVNHMRWVGSARTTRMGHRTAVEMGLPGLPPMRAMLANHLYRRQSQRCPYLFSVAPEGFDAGMPPGRTPPSLKGFPPTHDLLETAWRTYLAAMETLLAEQPYILGERFTLADASAYGQLGMNLLDPEAADLLKQLAPGVYAWLCAIRDGEHQHSDGKLRANSCLRPLLDTIGATFTSLMVQNEAAFVKEKAAGGTVFNEAAFDQRRALYTGELMGHPFRAVAKTFQVRVWRDIKRHWGELDQNSCDRLTGEYLPWSQLFE